jgi:hypothetical protein
MISAVMMSSFLTMVVAIRTSGCIPFTKPSVSPFITTLNRIAQLSRTHYGRFPLAANPSITLPTVALLGFDMHDVNMPTLLRSSVSCDIHILIGLTEARHNFHVPSEYNILSTDNLIPVYATIGARNIGK